MNGPALCEGRKINWGRSVDCNLIKVNPLSGSHENLCQSRARWANRPRCSRNACGCNHRSIAQSDHPDHRQFVNQGRDLFIGKGNCKQCHGATGMGDGQADNFDDWTTDWIKSARVNPFEPSTYQDFLEAGALPPRPIRPRNLNVPVFRGGDHPNDIFLRIHNGIEGTPMPASTALNADEVWAMVAYIRTLPKVINPRWPDVKEPSANSSN